jgi:ECF sigma factor
MFECQFTNVPWGCPSTLPDARGVQRLALENQRLARIVDLTFFCGFSFGEIGRMLGVSERTVQRDWEKARIYLHRVLRDDMPVDWPRRPA